VGIDSAFYEPPSEEVLTAYARGAPPRLSMREQGVGSDHGEALHAGPALGQPRRAEEPDFLNAGLFKDAVLGPYARAFSDHAGAFVFEFQAMRGKGSSPSRRRGRKSSTAS